MYDLKRHVRDVLKIVQREEGATLELAPLDEGSRLSEDPGSPGALPGRDSGPGRRIAFLTA